MPSTLRPDALADTTDAADTLGGPTHPRRLRLHPANHARTKRIVCPRGETIAGHGGALSARLRRFFAAEHIAGLDAVSADPRGWQAGQYMH